MSQDEMLLPGVAAFTVLVGGGSVLAVWIMSRFDRRAAQDNEMES